MTDPAPNADADHSHQSALLRRRFAWQFGALELQGALLMTACLWYFFSAAFEASEPKRQSEPIEEKAPVRLMTVVFAVVISLSGAYLSSRLATRHNLQRTWPRFSLQVVCTLFLVPPLLCVSAFLLPFVAYSMAKYWAGPATQRDQDG
jgi:hypothetical protein